MPLVLQRKPTLESYLSYMIYLKYELYVCFVIRMARHKAGLISSRIHSFIHFNANSILMCGTSVFVRTVCQERVQPFFQFWVKPLGQAHRTTVLPIVNWILECPCVRPSILVIGMMFWFFPRLMTFSVKWSNQLGLVSYCLILEHLCVRLFQPLVRSIGVVSLQSLWFGREFCGITAEIFCFSNSRKDLRRPKQEVEISVQVALQYEKNERQMSWKAEDFRSIISSCTVIQHTPSCFPTSAIWSGNIWLRGNTISPKGSLQSLQAKEWVQEKYKIADSSKMPKY